MPRAERAKPLQDDLTTTRNHTPKPTLGTAVPARAVLLFAWLCDEAPRCLCSKLLES